MTRSAEPPLDAPDADIAEQSQGVVPDEPEVSPSSSPEVDEYDAAEQSRIVELDEEEYR